MDLPLKLLYRGVKIELGNILKYDMSWRKRLWLYRHGFTSSRGITYDINSTNVEKYLNDIQHQKGYAKQFDINHKTISKDKLVSYLLLSQSYSSYVPELVAIIFPETGVSSVPNRSCDIDSTEGLLKYIQNRKVVVKPITGFSGGDIHVLEHNGEEILFDNKPVTKYELEDIFASLPDSIITEFVDQADYSNRIYPHTGNTIRLLTLVDPEENIPFIAAAVHRFGRDGSGQVDNWHKGGLAAGIDIDTGKIGRASISPREGDAEEFKRADYHPDTDIKIRGQTIPGWSEICNTILDIAIEYRGVLRYAGWDIIVTDNQGSFKIVEVNSGTDVNAFQTNEPLLDDERVYNFYEYYDIV